MVSTIIIDEEIEEVSEEYSRFQDILDIRKFKNGCYSIRIDFSLLEKEEESKYGSQLMKVQTK